jgi:hypothetical protein
MAWLRRSLSILGLAVAVAALLVVTWYAVQTAEQQRGRAEAAIELADLRGRRIAELETELAGALLTHGQVREMLEKQAGENAQARQAQQERLERALAPMPEGLRLTLDALHELLRRAGHGDVQVLEARAVTERALWGARVFRGGNGPNDGATLWQAEKVTFAIDRATSALTMTLQQGLVVRGGSTKPLPDDGDVVVFAEVDARACEARLPQLIAVSGEHPVAEPVIPPRARLDPFTAQRWRERLDQVLASARTTLRYRVHELQGLDQGWFLGVVLYGHTAGNRLEEMAEVERMALTVDDAGGIAELEMVGGVLRRAGGDVTLPATAPGRRILLPGVTPAAASRTLTGMVVKQ